jgi:S1-C subfamily serine protease
VRKLGGDARDTYILSNAHVIANEDRGVMGDAVLQPGRCDGGSVSGHLVARLTMADTLSRRGWNLTDSAIARVEPGVTADFATLRGLGELKGVSRQRIQKNMYVSKLGRTTHVTHGYVTAFEMDIAIGFSFGRAWFRNQIEVRGAYGSFVEGGDSGSLAVDSNGRAVGLIFAGGARTGILNPIQTVLDRLGVELALA